MDAALRHELANVGAPQGRQRNPRRGAASGGDFILDVPPYPICLWGSGARAAAAREEGTLLVGPPGAGKTTIAQRYVRARLGLDGEELLGMPVSRATAPVVYLAMDRPSQIARSFRRMTDEDDRCVLNDMLRVWQGPLPFDPVSKHEPAGRLAAWLSEQFGDVCEVIVDSYKDLGFSLVDDAHAVKLNLAMQECIASGIDWFGLHHHRKATGENKQPNKLDDVYGSRWVTAGVGSVLCLWGDAGGDVGTLTHLKQPAEPVGPLTVMHDRAAGAVRSVDLSGAEGSTQKVKIRRARILQAVHEAGRLTRAEVASLLPDVSDRTVRDDLKALVQACSLAAEGPETSPDRAYRCVYLDERMDLSGAA